MYHIVRIAAIQRQLIQGWDNPDLSADVAFSHQQQQCLSTGAIALR